MGVRKVAISVPEDVLVRIDKIAKRARMTRSSYISTVLGKITRAHRHSEITKHLDELFADKVIRQEQKKIADLFRKIPSGGGDEW